MTINLYDEYLDERTFDIEPERQRRRGNQRIKTTRDMKNLFTRLFTTLSLGSPPADGLRKREPPYKNSGKRNDRFPQRQAS